MPDTEQSLTIKAVAAKFDSLSERDLKEAVLAISTGGGMTLANAETLVNEQYQEPTDAFSDRRIMLCLAGYYSSPVNVAQHAVVEAAINKYPAMSEDALNALLLAALS